MRYIKDHKRLFYVNLLTSGELNSYLADINGQTEALFFRLIKQFAEKEGITAASFPYLRSRLSTNLWYNPLISEQLL